MEEVKKTSKHKDKVDRVMMDLHFKDMDTDDSGGIDLEEFVSGYTRLFHEERHQLACMLNAQHPGMLF